ncbi:transcription termination factor NusA [Candidatus Thioglobus sp.]|jgi:N utilization substance protein A|uniref:transcription termination factor NusA n=1 Tax=Candidatus Pseudothioglobus sp. Uisw_041 TaxID=3230996 RepID=UPI002333149D|nr:transcription termination factor NusA [Candidatus Thioglobus sp.]MDB9864694.1 transcription termination factor NusA [Candidatus Thioglobus sp.]MDB9865473.1 transcription termination factor NusA [Candidatus Thioglobus sp.]MDB9934004.1 transcription termination factor NusA [Candidatus Thioglobus sp.]MDB9938512.1 transcription termination factor NusA [Candidatus Thioglobus sp.]|tara:strand:- start:1230 stop:2705 length:1476 start_codon:yes stop_codon:yes gene_type:complete
MDGKELFLMVEAISNEKNITKDDVIESLEEALAVATKKRNNIEVRVEVDRHTGEFNTFRQWLVIEDGEKFVDDDGEMFDPELHIYQADSNGLDIDAFVEEPMESLEFGRIAAQVAKQVIIQKVREAERTVIVDNYTQRVGEVVMVTVKRVDRGNVFVDMGGIDGMISKFDLIPNESIRKNDRLRAYIKEVKSTPRGAQIFLSRTVNDMMIELFTMEVPEISEGVIEIKAGARDPGLRSKLAVKAKDKRIDPIGSCIGMRGARVQAVSNELNGERVDIILWDEDPAQFVINAMAPAEVSSIVVDEEKGFMDIAVEEDQLALAIGRGGQNIKLASRLTGWKLNVMSISDADDIQAKELQKTGEKLAEKLGVDAEVAAVLIDEGYTNLDEIAEAESDALSKIEEFDSDMVGELQERAQDAQLVKALTDAESTEILLSVEGVDEALAAALVEAEITTVDALAELSIVEVLEIQDVGNDSASAVIMAAREKEGWFD